MLFEWDGDGDSSEVGMAHLGDREKAVGEGRLILVSGGFELEEVVVNAWTE